MRSRSWSLVHCSGVKQREVKKKNHVKIKTASRNMCKGNNLKYLESLISAWVGTSGEH